MMIDKKLKLIVIIQVICSLTFSILTLVNILPFYFTNTDPTYEYLVNGMNLNYGVTPGHADHPGSTLQWLLAMTNRSYFNLFQVQENMKLDFVFQPENYAVFYSIIAMVCYSIIQYQLTIKLVFQQQKRIFQFYPLFLLIISYPYLEEIIAVKPENLMIQISSILIIAILIYETDTIKKFTSNKSYIYGILLAVGISTKFTFLILVPMILFIPTIRNKIKFLITTLIVLFTLNIKLLGTFSITWFLYIIVNGGRYGEVRQKNIEKTIYSFFDLIFIKFPVIAIVFALIIINFQNWKNIVIYLRHQRIFGILLSLASFSLILVVKEWLPRDFIFMVPVYTTILIYMVSKFMESQKSQIFKRITDILVSNQMKITILVVGLFTLDNSAKIIDTIRAKEINDVNTQNEHFFFEKSITDLISKGNIVVSDYNAPIQYAALQFGNAMYGLSVVSDEVDRYYPTSLQFIGSSIYNGKSEIIGCQFFPSFLLEDRGIFLLIRSKKELETRLDESPHGYKWTLSERYVENPRTGLDWKIYQVIKADCK